MRRRCGCCGNRFAGIEWSLRQGRRRESAHLEVPVCPRAGIDDPRRRAIECLPKLVAGDMLPDDLPILLASVSHGAGHESDRIRQRLLGVLEPDDSLRRLCCSRRHWNGFHKLRPRSRSLDHGKSRNLGSRSRVTALTASTRRNFMSAGSSRRFPSSKQDRALRVISGLNEAPYGFCAAVNANGKPTPPRRARASMSRRSGVSARTCETDALVPAKSSSEAISRPLSFATRSGARRPSSGTPKKGHVDGSAPIHGHGERIPLTLNDFGADQERQPTLQCGEVDGPAAEEVEINGCTMTQMQRRRGCTVRCEPIRHSAQLFPKPPPRLRRHVQPRQQFPHAQQPFEPACPPTFSRSMQRAGRCSQTRAARPGLCLPRAAVSPKPPHQRHAQPARRPEAARACSMKLRTTVERSSTR